MNKINSGGKTVLDVPEINAHKILEKKDFT